MRIPERDVGYRNRVAARAGRAQLILRYRNALVRERRTANRAKVFEVRDKPIAHAVEIRNFVERAPFALLRALAITGVEQGDVRCTVAFARHCRAHAGVHSSAQEHYCFPLLHAFHHRINSRRVSSFFFLYLKRPWSPDPK